MSDLAIDLRDADLYLDGKQILSDINLQAKHGECLALLGPSGAGKTSLLRLLNGVAGDVLKSQTERAKIGFVHQDHSLVPNVRVANNVLMGKLGAQGFWKSLRSQLRASKKELVEVHAVLERVGIADKLFERTDSLSGGEQQRVALARALYQQPQMLLADEPVASLDQVRARQIIELLHETAHQEGWTFVVSLHDEALAKEFFPRIIRMEGGRIISDGENA
ncbi:MAG: ATP-binding cassette domain-containing protein [Planctomycetota bacterium]|nr:ATP-binding cassette domain-containing protein [Planctomycetota bacterium]